MQNKLHSEQINLLMHLARFNLLPYEDCLEMLRTPERTTRRELADAFRPLTRHGYVSRREDGCVSILAKGRRLFSELEPLISVGGGEAEHKRIMEVSCMAVLMEKNAIPSAGQIPETGEACFIPSACWRNIAPGILSTTRFAGMLVGHGQRLAVYDIKDGRMEWQIRAEGSLFYTKYGSYETKATGMLLICREDKREAVAENIIRHTMWNRKQLLRERCVERDRPTRWSRSPIKLKANYYHAYLTTPSLLGESLQRIWSEEDYIEAFCDDDARSSDPQSCDVDLWPRRLFVNPATDLLKFVYFFAAVKGQMDLVEDGRFFVNPTNYEIYIQPMDRAILRMYPEIIQSEEVAVYVYKSEQDVEDN